ncbi:MAG: 30S ribosomal protein S6, partial [Ruminococcaceae bacterium]|nr:30S ribosomal protein S6 [Oscillospiraceae bacterium]
KRRLAYPIGKVGEGYYVLASFESAPEFPLELERLMRINDAILRSMTIRLEKAPEASVAAPAAAPAEEATDAE